MQEQAKGLEKYLQHLGQLHAFQKGIEQAIGKQPQGTSQDALPQGTSPQKPRVPIPGGNLLAHECSKAISTAFNSC